MDRKKLFIEIFRKLEKKYGKNEKRLASEGWDDNWQTLIATIMSAQSRDETTISIAERLFERYDALDKLAGAKYEEVLLIFKGLNYNRNKSKNVIAAANFILKEFRGKLPYEINELIRIPGVGRKTANLIITECFNMDGICVDTHVHRISNVLGLVKTKNPEQTEYELMKVAPKKCWSKINRLFVLWGKEVFGRDKNKFIASLNE